MQHVLLVYDSLDRSYVDRKFSAPLACKIQMRIVNLHMQLFCVDMFPCGSFKKHLNESVLSLLRRGGALKTSTGKRKYKKCKYNANLQSHKKVWYFTS